MFCGTLLVAYFEDICHSFLQKAPVGFSWAFDMLVRMIFLNYMQKFSFIRFFSLFLTTYGLILLDYKLKPKLAIQAYV